MSVRELGFAETSAARAVDRRWRRIVVGVGFERAVADPVAGSTAAEAVAGLHPVGDIQPPSHFSMMLLWALSLW